MAKRWRSRRFGELKHDERRVRRASDAQGLRGTRRMNVEIKMDRYHGKFSARACLKKSLNVRGGYASGTRAKRASWRCGVGVGVTPTRAAGAAMRELSNVLDG